MVLANKRCLFISEIGGKAYEKHNPADTWGIFQRDCAVLSVYSWGCAKSDSLKHYAERICCTDEGND